MMKDSKTNKAFTLAETLITLTIIGVIAALTIPNLLAKYQEHVTVTKVKKFYSIMSNAVKMATNENGPIDTWAIQSSEDLIKPIIKYLKISKDCGINANTGCIPKESYYISGAFFANYDSNPSGNQYYKFALNDESVVWSRWNRNTTCNNADGGINNVCGVVFYDINGTRKPNKYGIDIFRFQITKDSLYSDISGCQKNTGKGFGCSSFIIKNGHMNYPD